TIALFVERCLNYSYVCVSKYKFTGSNLDVEPSLHLTGLSNSFSTIMMPDQFVDRTTDLKAIEHGIRNKFRWQWLEEKDCNGDFLSDYVRKLKKKQVLHFVFIVISSLIIVRKEGVM
ncbi:hypothetical protein EGW08_016678, partial [Elysia chlorotica]